MRIKRVPAWCGAMLALAITCAMGGTAAAQWLSLPLPGTPRAADGKPNLNAPTPHTADGKPDLSGIWRADTMRYNENLLPQGTDAPMLPWAAELYKHRVDTKGYDRPIEMGGTGQLVRAGWKRDSMKIGDMVTVEARRARDGSNNANAQTAVLVRTGQRLFAGSSQGQ